MAVKLSTVGEADRKVYGKKDLDLEHISQDLTKDAIMDFIVGHQQSRLTRL